jgi:hypothetical protein
MMDDSRWLEVQHRNKEFIGVVEDACAEHELQALFTVVGDAKGEIYLMYPKEIHPNKIALALEIAQKQHFLIVGGEPHEPTI